jgi:hypothetical protein
LPSNIFFIFFQISFLQPAKPFQSTYFNYSYNTWVLKLIINLLIHFYSPVTTFICRPILFF